MAKLGSSLTLEGPGIIPAQDHRPDIDIEKRACHVAARVIDMRDDFVRYHVDDEELRGDVQGLSVWTLDDRSTSPRPCVMWRHAWPSMVEGFGDAFTEEPPPADAFPSFPETPGGGGGGGSDSWTPGNVTLDPRARPIFGIGGVPPGSQPIAGKPAIPPGWFGP